MLVNVCRYYKRDSCSFAVVQEVPTSAADNISILNIQTKHFTLKACTCRCIVNEIAKFVFFSSFNRRLVLLSRLIYTPCIQRKMLFEYVCGLILFKVCIFSDAALCLD